MAELEITIANLGAVQDALGAVPDLVGRAVDDGITIGAAELADAVRGETPVGATGILRASIIGTTDGTGIHTVGRVLSQDDPIKVIGVEQGRGPGAMPPWQPGSSLAVWVTRVLGDPGAAYVVARAIAQRGTKPARMFEKGFTAKRASVIARIERAVADALARGR